MRSDRMGLVIALVFAATAIPSLARAAPKAGGERYALLVGVREYDPNELRSLPYAEADVAELAQVLRDAGFGHVVLMTQAEGARRARLLPTAANIRTTLKGMLQDREPGDTVVVAFAGHGIQFRGAQESYFCPMDARLSARSTLVPIDEVYKGLEGCKAGIKLFLVDACRNDPQSDNSRSRSVVTLESVTRPQALRPPGGVAAIFSCSSGERSFEHDRLKHGVFYHFVIRGLKGDADLDGDGQVGVEELALFAKRRVPDFVKEEYGFDVRQMPVLRGEVEGLSSLVAADPAATACRRGEELAAKRDYPGAIAAFDQALRLDPKRAEALRGRGAARVEADDYKGAIDDYNAAFELGPADAPLHALRGRAYFKSSEWDRAIADCTEAIRLDPEAVKAWNVRGAAYDALAQPDRAIADYTEAIRLDPKFYWPYANRGTAYVSKKQYDRAIADYSEAIRLGKNDALVYRLRGNARYAAAQYDLALADYDELIRLDPKSSFGYSNRGLVRHQKKQYDRAIEDFSEAIRLDPKNAAAFENRAAAREIRGDKELARADRSAAGRLKPAPKAASNAKINDANLEEMLKKFFPPDTGASP